MYQPEHIHIAIASDENYACFVAILIASVIDNNKDFESINFHLLSNGISKNSIRDIEAVAKDDKVNLLIYDISDLEKRLEISVPPTIALTSYARLYMNRLLPNDISRVLYLDTDIIVYGSLSSLWRSQLDGYLVGGCLDIFEGTASKTDIGLLPTSPYINAGVLLINLDQWRKESLDEKFIDFLKSHNGEVHHHDQGIINGVCKDKLLLLSPEYNMHSTVFSHPYSLIRKIIIPYYDKQDYDRAIKYPIIIHFTEGFYNRPWKEHCKHPYRFAFDRYKAKTPWYRMSIQKDNRSSAVKLLSWTFLHLPYRIYKLISSSLGMLKNYALK